ncbi:MAG: hypothetical protein R2794_10150 [Chitinophagales bacterium]
MKKWLFIACCALLSACTNYGTKIDITGDEVYYKDPITEEQATAVGNFLKSYNYFQGAGVSVQVIKDSDYRVRFVTKEGIENDPEIINGFKILLLDMSADAFGGSAVNVDLCDEHLKTKTTILYTDAQKYMGEQINNALTE